MPFAKSGGIIYGMSIGNQELNPISHHEANDPKLIPEDVRVAGGIPLYYLFLANPNPVNISSQESQEARSRLASLIAIDREKVLSCQGKTREQAQAILTSIEASQGH